MKLNLDCIRAILLKLEELPYGESYSSVNFGGLCSTYSQEDIDYSIKKLTEAHFIETDVSELSDESYTYILDITYEGHQFLANIRDNTIWHVVRIGLPRLISIRIVYPTIPAPIPAIKNANSSISFTSHTFYVILNL